jgi:hypothetical protein
MLMTRARIVTAALVTASVISCSAGTVASKGLAESQSVPTNDLSRLSQEAAARYAAIKPRLEELKWRQIPWLIDLNKAIRLAKEEKRPLLVWTGQQSHPLERC